VGFLNEVLCETGCVAVVVEGCLILSVACREPPASLLNICLVAVHFSACVDILQKKQWTMDPGVHNVQQKTIFYPTAS
jgi:hypothetical protein